MSVPARRAALREAHRHAHAGQYAAEDHRQNTFEVEEVALRQHRLPEVHPQRDHHDAVDGLHAEVPADDESRDQQQYSVDDEYHRTDLNRDAEPLLDGMAQHERQTRGPSADAFGGQDAADPRERVHDHADRHQEILLDGLQHQLLNDGFHFGTEILAIAKAKIVQTEGKSKSTCILPKRRLSKT